jgi:hypothetical protein
MRCVQFDREVIRALQVLGFKVEADNEVASMEATVSLIHPAGNECFLVSVSLPCGDALNWQLTRAKLLDTAAEWAESVS